MKKQIAVLAEEDAVNKFTKNASMSGALWRACEIHALSKIKMQRPILDLGAGNGRFASIVFTDKLDYALDISKADIAKAKSKKAYKKYFVSPGHKIPLKASSVNTVFSNSVFEHIHNMDEVLTEINRVLKKNGELIFTTHLPDSKKYFGEKILKSIKLDAFAAKYKKLYIDMHQLNTVWSLAKWERKLVKAGFKIKIAKKTASPEILKLYELFMPLSFIQNRFVFLKKLQLTKILFNLINPPYKTHKGNYNILIVAKKA